MKYEQRPYQPVTGRAKRLIREAEARQRRKVTTLSLRILNDRQTSDGVTSTLEMQVHGECGPILAEVDLRCEPGWDVTQELTEAVKPAVNQLIDRIVSECESRLANK